MDSLTPREDKEERRADKIDDKVARKLGQDTSSEYDASSKRYVPGNVRFDTMSDDVGESLMNHDYYWTPAAIARRYHLPLSEIMATLPAKPILEAGHWYCAEGVCNNQTLGNTRCSYHRSILAKRIGPSSEYRLTTSTGIGSKTIKSDYYIGISSAHLAA
jgi:hypothetical protein